MAVSLNDGRVGVWFVAGDFDQEDIDSGSVSGGTALHCSLDADGGLPDLSHSEQAIVDSNICRVVDAKRLGRITYDDIVLRFLKQDPDDGVTALMARGTKGVLIVRRDQDNLASPSGAKELYPVVCSERFENAVAKNSIHKYSIPLIVTGVPNLNA